MKHKYIKILSPIFLLTSMISAFLIVNWSSKFLGLNDTLLGQIFSGFTSIFSFFNPLIYILLSSICIYFIIDFFLGTDESVKFSKIFQIFSLFAIMLTINDIITYLILNSKRNVLEAYGNTIQESSLYIMIQIKNFIVSYLHLLLSMIIVKIIYKVSIINLLIQIALLTGVFLFWHKEIFQIG